MTNHDTFSTTDPTTASTTEATTDPGATAAGPARFYGWPEQQLAAAWTVQDLCRFFGISERKARALMAAPDAPPKLRLGSERCDRWNPYQVLAWAHGADWTTLAGFTAAVTTGPAVPPTAGPTAGSTSALRADRAARPALTPSSSSPVLGATTGPAGRGAPGRPWTPRPPARAGRTRAAQRGVA